MLTLDDLLISSGRYPDRKSSPECTYEVILNAGVLLARVNALLSHLGVTASVTSGFRTKAANAAAGGAPHSAHLLGKAVDLFDPLGGLDKCITDELLAQFDLYREDPARTKGWVHLQTRPTASGNRTFTI